MEVLDQGLNGRKIIGAEGFQGRLYLRVGRNFWIRRQVGGVGSERDTPEFGVCFLSPTCEERFIGLVINKTD